MLLRYQFQKSINLLRNYSILSKNNKHLVKKNIIKINKFHTKLNKSNFFDYYMKIAWPLSLSFGIFGSIVVYGNMVKCIILDDKKPHLIDYIGCTFLFPFFIFGGFVSGLFLTFTHPILIIIVAIKYIKEH